MLSPTALYCWAARRPSERCSLGGMLAAVPLVCLTVCAIECTQVLTAKVRLLGPSMFHGHPLGNIRLWDHRTRVTGAPQ